MTPTYALELDALVKDFGRKRAVDHLSLRVPHGQMFGLVGPNGAGKTTTCNMATGLLRPTSGRAWVCGVDVWADPPMAKAAMGVLPDAMRLFDRLSGREHLRMVGRLRRLPGDEARARAERLLDVLDLSADADTLVADYSAGMTKKMGLACSLIHGPRLLVLDEPFESVDPVSAQSIRQILSQFVSGGGTVVVSSHVMELVESLCHALAIVSQGRVLAAGTVDEVRAGMSLQDRFVQLVGAPVHAGEGLEWLRS